MKKGTRVTWVTARGVHGNGEVLTDELDGHVLVAVSADKGEEHRVIYCTVTWLNVDPGPLQP